mmetsp:Transcript_61023/g.72429  ORF Transcript_61023/g.72429 Transcript_61023/m.72429 type:complete len:88 (-) Transcript_61023:225-488(-)
MFVSSNYHRAGFSTPVSSNTENDYSLETDKTIPICGSRASKRSHENLKTIARTKTSDADSSANLLQKYKEGLKENRSCLSTYTLLFA